MNASVGLIAMWTGELSANVEHMKTMAIHQMNECELDEFAKYLRDANHALSSLSNYVKQTLDAI